MSSMFLMRARASSASPPRAAATMAALRGTSARRNSLGSSCSGGVLDGNNATKKARASPPSSCQQRETASLPPLRRASPSATGGKGEGHKAPHAATPPREGPPHGLTTPATSSSSSFSLPCRFDVRSPLQPPLRKDAQRAIPLVILRGKRRGIGAVRHQLKRTAAPTKVASQRHRKLGGGLAGTSRAILRQRSAWTRCSRADRFLPVQTEGAETWQTRTRDRRRRSTSTRPKSILRVGTNGQAGLPRDHHAWGDGEGGNVATNGDHRSSWPLAYLERHGDFRAGARRFSTGLHFHRSLRVNASRFCGILVSEMAISPPPQKKTSQTDVDTAESSRAAGPL